MLQTFLKTNNEAASPAFKYIPFNTLYLST